MAADAPPITHHHVHFVNRQFVEMQQWYMKAFNATLREGQTDFFIGADLPGVGYMLNFFSWLPNGGSRRHGRPRRRPRRLRGPRPASVLRGARSARASRSPRRIGATNALGLERRDHRRPLGHRHRAHGRAATAHEVRSCGAAQRRRLGAVVTGKTALLRAQRRWADAHGVRYDAHGCVRDLADNLRVPLDGAALAELQRGSELTPGASAPARIYSLCSSAALVVNVFEYWRGRDATPLAARRSASRDRRNLRLTFEEPLPTGLGRRPADHRRRARPAPTAATSRSRASSPSGWCRGRAASVRSRTSISRDGDGASGRRPACRAAKRSPRICKTAASGCKLLHAPQLLKHALGLGEERPRNEHARVPVLRLAGARSGDASQRARPRRSRGSLPRSTCAC